MRYLGRIRQEGRGKGQPSEIDLEKSTIGKFVIYASDMVPEGCIFFCHPDDLQILIEAIKMMEDLPLDPKERKLAQEFMVNEMKKSLTPVHGYWEVEDKFKKEKS